MVRIFAAIYHKEIPTDQVAPAKMGADHGRHSTGHWRNLRRPADPGVLDAAPRPGVVVGGFSVGQASRGQSETRLAQRQMETTKLATAKKSASDRRERIMYSRVIAADDYRPPDATA